MKIRSKVLIIFGVAMLVLFSVVFVLSTRLVAGIVEARFETDPALVASETRRQFVSVFLVAFTVSGGVLFLLVFFGLDRAVLSPIRNLQLRVAAARDNPLDLGGSGGDEVALLAREIERLTESVRAADQERRALSGKLLAAQDEERRRIARDLHDSTAQVITAMQMNLSILSTSLGAANPQARRLLEETRDMANQCSGEIRTVAHLLHPPLLDEVGLVFAARLFVDGFQKRSGTAVEFHASKELPRMAEDVETALFRVVQESLSNVHRHAEATRVSVTILQVEDGALVEIGDNGNGGASGDPTTLGVGLLGMRERLAQFGGTLEVVSEKRGTVVRGFVPLDWGEMR
jgi:signal transduction histidine kinase